MSAPAPGKARGSAGPPRATSTARGGGRGRPGEPFALRGVAEQPLQRLAQRRAIVRRRPDARRPPRRPRRSRRRRSPPTGLPNASAVASTPESRTARSASRAARRRRRGGRTPAARRRTTKRGTNRDARAQRAPSGSIVILGRPTIHSSAPCTPRHASSSTSTPLYGRSRPKNSTTGPRTAPTRRERRSPGGASGARMRRAGSRAPWRGRARSRTAARDRSAEWTTTASTASYSRCCARAWPGCGSRGSRSCAVSTSRPAR